MTSAKQYQQGLELQAKYNNYARASRVMLAGKHLQLSQREFLHFCPHWTPLYPHRNRQFLPMKATRQWRCRAPRAITSRFDDSRNNPAATTARRKDPAIRSRNPKFLRKEQKLGNRQSDRNSESGEPSRSPIQSDRNLDRRNRGGVTMLGAAHPATVTDAFDGTFYRSEIDRPQPHRLALSPV
jgi:hypothetical protein